MNEEQKDAGRPAQGGRGQDAVPPLYAALYSAIAREAVRDPQIRLAEAMEAVEAILIHLTRIDRLEQVTIGTDLRPSCGYFERLWGLDSLRELRGLLEAGKLDPVAARAWRMRLRMERLDEFAPPEDLERLERLIEGEPGASLDYPSGEPSAPANGARAARTGRSGGEKGVVQ